MKKSEQMATHHHEKNSMMDIMRQMNLTMDSMKMTGDTDHDFAAMMIVHHRAAIEMAQQQIDSGLDITLKKFAKKIIEDQTREIRELEQWLKQQH